MYLGVNAEIIKVHYTEDFRSSVVPRGSFGKKYGNFGGNVGILLYGENRVSPGVRDSFLGWSNNIPGRRKKSGRKICIFHGERYPGLKIVSWKKYGKN